jgi:hypothetical protein
MARNKQVPDQILEDGVWPGWAKWVVSGFLVWHLSSQVAAQLSAQPSSGLERAVADLFAPYYEGLDLGHAYRYYAPEPGPTPIVQARLTYGDGRPDVEVRLPDRDLAPRLRYQRHLNLANHMFNDSMQARAHEHEHPPDQPPHEPNPGRWAASYARHLARIHPGAKTVSIYTTRHLLPNLADIAREGIPDVDDERYYEVLTLIGEFPCDDF